MDPRLDSVSAPPPPPAAAPAAARGLGMADAFCPGVELSLRGRAALPPADLGVFSLRILPIFDTRSRKLPPPAEPGVRDDGVARVFEGAGRRCVQ